jgi:hypothetical protein
LGIDAAAPDANDGNNISISGMLQRGRISRREAGSLGIIERYLAELVAPIEKWNSLGYCRVAFRNTEALMLAVANLDDSYIPRTSELIRIEFAERERDELCARGSADTAEHLFATALDEKLAGISEREHPQYLRAA